MSANAKQELLRELPSLGQLLESPQVKEWLLRHPRGLVTHCLRQSVEELRRQILEDTAGRCGAAHVRAEYILQQAAERLEQALTPQLRRAINATGIILHTGLGRAVWPARVVEGMAQELKGYVSLAVDRQSGLRSDRDQRVEYILTELTGAEAATVVNNNAAATLLVLSALTAGHEVVVSRGQLIEIGGAFRLPEVMALSGAKLVEVGTTNRTHGRDYLAALTDQTAALLRVHPSNFRVVGFTQEVSLEEMAQTARQHNLLLIDDLGAGALVDLAQFGLPHEPTVQESLEAGADVVLFSADKLIGAAQGGVIVGKAALIDRIRKHPLARACRVDKAQLMVLERTLMLFRDIDLLKREHPLYQKLSLQPAELRSRADELAQAILAAAPKARAEVVESACYLGSGSLPTEALPSFAVAVTVEGLAADGLARRLRMDPEGVFGRIENERVLLDVRTLAPAELPAVAAAVGRAAGKRE